MSEHSRREAAQKAGVEPGYIDRLVELGIVRSGSGDVFSPGDVRTVRWVQSLERAGVPLDGIAAVVKAGGLSFSYLDVAAFDRFSDASEISFGQLSETTGVPLRLLKMIREAAGSAEPQPEDRLREDELTIANAIEGLLSAGYRPIAIESWLRVCGDGLRRIAETETDWYRSEIEMPLLEKGMTEGEMLQAQAELGSRISPAVEEALVAIYHGQQEHAWTKSAVEDVEAALEKAGVYSRPRRMPAVSFLDITGYTRLTEEQGDEAAAQVAEKLTGLVRRSSVEHGGQPIKWLGDGGMFLFPDPGQGVMAALDMVDGAAAQALPPAHVGIHAGPVVFQDGDYFGRTVNIASRITDYARPGEVVVSQEVVDAAAGGPVTFREIGQVELRGVVGALRLHAASRPS